MTAAIICAGVLLLVLAAGALTLPLYKLRAWQKEEIKKGGV